MYFLNDSKQAKMNFFQLLELSLNAVNWTIDQIPDWY